MRVPRHGSIVLIAIQKDTIATATGNICASSVVVGVMYQDKNLVNNRMSPCLGALQSHFIKNIKSIIYEKSKHTNFSVTSFILHKK